MHAFIGDIIFRSQDICEKIALNISCVDSRSLCRTDVIYYNCGKIGYCFYWTFLFFFFIKNNLCAIDIYESVDIKDA